MEKEHKKRKEFPLLEIMRLRMYSLKRTISLQCGVVSVFSLTYYLFIDAGVYLGLCQKS